MTQEEMIQLYKYSKPTECFLTQYGKIPVSQWLEKEKERIERNTTRKAEIRYNKEGKVGLWVNKVVSIPQ